MRRLLVLVLSTMLFSCGGDKAPKLLVLGVDGMDPQLLQRLMTEDKMPNFARLAAEGGFTALATSVPPQSPVAWSTFITGLDPDGHGIEVTYELPRNQWPRQDQVFEGDGIKKGLFPGPWDTEFTRVH